MNIFLSKFDIFFVLFKKYVFLCGSKFFKNLMSMDRRLKIITIAFSLIYVAIMGGQINRLLAEVIYGFKMGIKIAETGDISTLSEISPFFIYLKPINGYHTYPTTMRNHLDGKPMKVEIEQITVELTDVKERLPKWTATADIYMVALSFFAMFVMLFIPIQTIRIIHSITNNKVFDPTNIKKMRSIGYALLVFQITSLIYYYVHYSIASSVVNVEGYMLRMNWGNVSSVLLGFVVLMFAEVLKVSVQMKEEQDLTV